MHPLGTELLIHQVGEVKLQLQQALAALPAGEDLALDCGALADLDGAGLQMLAVLAMDLRRRDAALKLVGCTDELRRRITAAALDNHFAFAAAEAA